MVALLGESRGRWLYRRVRGLDDGRVDPSHDARSLSRDETFPRDLTRLEDLERQHIERTLKHHTGNRTRAAIELGISRATLINKIKRYNLTA